MTLPNTLVPRTAAWLACITSISSVLAQNLPYNPTYLISGNNSRVYQLSPETSPQFSVYDVSKKLSTSDSPDALISQLPFLSNASNAFVPVATRDGLTVFSGECSGGQQELELWTYGYDMNGSTWTQMHTTSSHPHLSANFLAAAFSFPSSNASDGIYVFGGMCPNGTSNATSWTTNAAYSNTLLAISPAKGTDYDVSLTGARSPPIAEAGLSITPLQPATFKADNTAAQQNFVLIGGHTQNAFINMSQVAMFSMPLQSWAFIGVNQPIGSVVEPRSGHSAVMSEDGSRIFVFGGWVGDVTRPATPQLAVLEIGAGYGGNGSWVWTVPNVKEPYLGGSGDGVYGHGAVMLPGNIMMVTGGHSIAGTGLKVKRAPSNPMFYNTTSASWSQTYTNPNLKSADGTAHSTLSPTAKTGLGTGLGVGISAALVVGAAVFFYLRRKRQQRRMREQHLRDLALGTNDAFSTAELSRPGSRGIFSGYRSASWGGRQEERIESSRYHQQPSAWEPNDSHGENLQHHDQEDSHRLYVPDHSFRVIPRPTGPLGVNGHSINGLPAPSGVFTIEEVEEQSEQGSIKRPPTAEGRPLSNPFKDPPNLLADEAAARRKQEVQEWMDDWHSAAENLNVSRRASKANSRTYSNISAYHSASSGDKSDRTNSDLSDKSNTTNLSGQKSGAGSIGRTISQRSGFAGYAVFAGAAAAVGRLAGKHDHAAVERSASKRAVSHGDLAQMAVQKRTNSVNQHGHEFTLETPNGRHELNTTGDYSTPPESPIKDYKTHSRKRSDSFSGQSNSLTSQSRKALGALSLGAKRILTGTNSVNVHAKVDAIESRSRDSSPTKNSDPEMSEDAPRRVSSTGATFWRHKQGAKDWDDSGIESSGTIRRRSGRPPVEDATDAPRNDDDWDVETAVQQRVVQVMFTVPKEKLRVVNADNLSMISRTDTNASRTSDRSDDAKEVQRMSRVTEDGEDESTIVGSAQLATTTFHPESGMVLKGKERAEILEGR